jgi:hypothetical protein
VPNQESLDGLFGGLLSMKAQIFEVNSFGFRPGESQVALECGSLLPLSFRPACWPCTEARYRRANSPDKSGSKLPHSRASRASSKGGDSGMVHLPAVTQGRGNDQPMRVPMSLDLLRRHHHYVHGLPDPIFKLGHYLRRVRRKPARQSVVK